MLRNRSWGGVGCDSIVDLARMVDATQQMVGWGGVGCNSILDLARMVDATQQMGWWGGRMCSIAEISDTVLVRFGMFYLH